MIFVIMASEKEVLTMAEYIEREAFMKRFCERCNEEMSESPCEPSDCFAREVIKTFPAADVVPVRHGRWLLEANKDKVNCRWNVTAECSNCCDEKKEIWAGFFPNVPDWLARDTALIDAKSVKLSNYCPNCGAKMDGGDGNSDMA